VEFTAEAITADAAIAKVRAQFLERLRANGQLRTMTLENAQAIAKAAAKLAKNPLLQEMQRARDEFRRTQDALAEAETT
jgi:hypothetical protein